jgi:sialate O-acetylesterase
MKHLLRSITFAALLVPVAAARAGVEPNNLLTDHAVLQRGKEVPVWGTARPEEEITVRFADQEVATKAGKDGKWLVKLAPMEASSEGRTLTIRGDYTIELHDVVVGEVWLASGQSNMQWPVAASSDPEATIAAANDENIRLYTVPRRGADAPESDPQGNWHRCTPGAIGGFSAVAYAFAQDLRKALNVPVGIISTNYGGTPAESWTSRGTLESCEELKPLLEIKDKGVHTPTVLYNAMIAPLVPYAIRGAIWYQGESNAGNAKQYRTLFPAMIGDWRQAFGQGDFPFLFVQLAPFMAKTDEPVQSGWAELREAQLLTLTAAPNTGMAVITDLGDEKDIHPKQKQPVGARLALAARKLAYGDNDVVYSGPIFQEMKIEGDHAVLTFDHVGGGLVAKDGPLSGFAIAGSDGTFVKAKAEIRGDAVVVSSPEVREPKAVRYGWANFPVVNLTNKEGLPASPFRTDR